ncbi:MAG: hypothetical protein Kow00133_16760 [Amphiplicatus sp.]|jgi:hypothetical protein
MKIIAGPIAVALSAVVIGLTAPALATSVDDQVALCAAALDAEGIAAADAYRARFVKSRGGAAKTVRVKMIPLGEGESITAECKIKRGEVTDVSVKA